MVSLVVRMPSTIRASLVSRSTLEQSRTFIDRDPGDLNWWYNATNFNRTIQLVDLATDYILAQSRPDQFTLSLINEPMPSALYFGQTNESMAYLNKYYDVVLPRIRSKSKDMWVMLSDGFSDHRLGKHNLDSGGVLR